MGTSKAELSYEPNGKPSGRPKKRVVDGRQECSTCHLWKPLEAFYPAKHTANGRETRCSDCNRKRVRKYLSEDTPTYLHYLWRAHKAVAGRYRTTARRRLMAAESEVNHDLLLKLWSKQEGLCAVTKVGMTHVQGHGFSVLTNVTIDRIDSDRGYEASNVRLVCKAVNFMKNAMSDDEMLKWAALILNGPLANR